MSTMYGVEEKEHVLQDDAMLPEDMERFRMATLRAKLALYGVYAERDADEDLLCRMLNIAKMREERRLAQEKKYAQLEKQRKDYQEQGCIDE